MQHLQTKYKNPYIDYTRKKHADFVDYNRQNHYLYTDYNRHYG